MRFLDLAGAGMIGFTVIIAGVALNPGPADSSSLKSAEVIALRSDAVDEVGRIGFVWLQRATPQDLCLWLASISNATVKFTGRADGSWCSGQPAPEATKATLSLEIGTEELTLVAWSPEGR